MGNNLLVISVLGDIAKAGATGRAAQGKKWTSFSTRGKQNGSTWPTTPWQIARSTSLKTMVQRVLSTVTGRVEASLFSM